MGIYNNTEVCWPVSLQEVYGLLGVAPTANAGYDIGTICCNGHGKINPASKVKPIRYKGPGNLLFSQFKGTPNDHADGIYYGLRCALHQGQGDGTQDSSRGWVGLHLCDWSYLPPIPGKHFSRLTDFALSPSEAGSVAAGGIMGYRHDASFNPQGSVDSISGAGAVGTLYYDRPTNIPCAVKVYTDTNNKMITTLGVNLQEVAGVTDIGEWYPCILISSLNDDGAIVGPHLARALAEPNRPESAKYQKLHNSSDAWPGSYVAETYAEVGGGDTVTRSSFPWPEAPCRKIATLFITKDIGSGLTAFANLQKWTDVGDMVPQTAYTVPGGAGIILNFARYYAQGMTFKSAMAYLLKNANGQVVDSNIRVSVLWDSVCEEDNKPIADVNYTFHVTLTDSAGDMQNIVGAGQQTVQGKYLLDTYVPGDFDVIPMAQIDIRTELVGNGILGGGSTTFNIHWWVTSDKTGTRYLNEGYSSVTYTY